MTRTAETKAQRQEWWKKLTLEEQIDYVQKKGNEKARFRRARSIKLMADKPGQFSCRGCFHRKTQSCEDNLPNGCEYWYDPADKKQGLAYKTPEKPLTKKQRRQEYSDKLWRRHKAKIDTVSLQVVNTK